MFKTFNKVDEKSQTYSESVEAVGEILKQGVGMFGTLGISMYSLYNVIKLISLKTSEKAISAYMSKIMLPFAFIFLPIIGIDIYTTKAQKKASRVADMLALKELNDYRHYIDYSKPVKKGTNLIRNIVK